MTIRYEAVDVIATKNIDQVGRAIYKRVARKATTLETINGFTLTLSGDVVGVTVFTDAVGIERTARVEKAVWLRLLVSDAVSPLLNLNDPFELMMANGSVTVSAEGNAVELTGKHL